MIGLLIAIVYICFISLGLPDSLLGSAWPTMYIEFGVPLSYAGIVSICISLCTVISSLLSDRLTKKFTPPIVTACSILLTAIGLLGFGLSTKFWMLIVFAIPYGLGAGAIDACLNNYVALHFKPKHMSWLHCMWGLGATISPYIMGYALTYLHSWNDGYLIVAIIQSILCAIIFLTIPVWKKAPVIDVLVDEKEEENDNKPLTIKDIVNIPGALPCFIMFFCYCSFEASSFLWSSSYLNINRKVDATLAANLACLYYGGMTIGRFINGFLTMKFDENKLIRGGSILVGIGACILFIPNTITSYIGLIVMGLGSAPIYPCIIHLTPYIFGKKNSQALIGVQMACAYTGSSLMPPLFGLIANNISISLFPVWVLLLLVCMVVMHEIVKRKTIKK